MRAWGQVEGRRIEAPEQGGGGVDWWPDSALRAESGAVRGYHASMRSPCGTYSAKRRHRRHGEICAACGVKEGDYE